MKSYELNRSRNSIIPRTACGCDAKKEVTVPRGVHPGPALTATERGGFAMIIPPIAASAISTLNSSAPLNRARLPASDVDPHLVIAGGSDGDPVGFGISTATAQAKFSDERPRSPAARICGWDVTDEMVNALYDFIVQVQLAGANALLCAAAASQQKTVIDRIVSTAECAQRAVKEIKNISDGLAGPNGSADFKPQGRRPPYMECPTPDCEYTVTLCGFCVNAEVPGNMALGFGTEWLVGSTLAGQAFSIGYAAVKKQEVEESQDLRAVGKGGKAARKLKKARRKPKRPLKDDIRDALCAAVREFVSNPANADKYTGCEPCI